MSQVDEKESEEVFMIVVLPLQLEEEWEGTLQKIAKITHESNSNLE